MTLKSEYSQSLPKGFRGSGVSAGLKSSGAKDLALIVNEGPDNFAISQAQSLLPIKL